MKQCSATLMIAFEDYLYQAKVFMITKSAENTLLPVHIAGRSRRPFSSLIALWAGRTGRTGRTYRTWALIYRQCTRFTRHFWNVVFRNLVTAALKGEATTSINKVYSFSFRLGSTFSQRGFKWFWIAKESKNYMIRAFKYGAKLRQNRCNIVPLL